MTAEQARHTTFWERLPGDYKVAIVEAAHNGQQYVQVDAKYMDNDIQYALQELGYFVYKNKKREHYEIRW